MAVTHSQMSQWQLQCHPWTLATHLQHEISSTHLLLTQGSFPEEGLKEPIVSTCAESVTQQSDQRLLTSELHFIAGHDPQEQQGCNPHCTTPVSQTFRKASCCTDRVPGTHLPAAISVQSQINSSGEELICTQHIPVVSHAAATFYCYNRPPIRW